jgi:hypothetical protein
VCPGVKDTVGRGVAGLAGGAAERSERGEELEQAQGIGRGALQQVLRTENLAYIIIIY